MHEWSMELQQNDTDYVKAEVLLWETCAYVTLSTTHHMAWPGNEHRLPPWEASISVCHKRLSVISPIYFHSVLCAV